MMDGFGLVLQERDVRVELSPDGCTFLRGQLLFVDVFFEKQEPPYEARIAFDFRVDEGSGVYVLNCQPEMCVTMTEGDRVIWKRPIVVETHAVGGDFSKPCGVSVSVRARVPVAGPDPCREVSSWAQNPAGFTSVHVVPSEKTKIDVTKGHR